MIMTPIRIMIWRCDIYRHYTGTIYFVIVLSLGKTVEMNEMRKEHLHLLQPFTERLGFILKRGHKAYIGQGTMLVCDPEELSFCCCWWRIVKLTREGRPTLIKGKGIRRKVHNLRLRGWRIISDTTTPDKVSITDAAARNLITLTPCDINT